MVSAKERESETNFVEFCECRFKGVRVIWTKLYIVS
jgi:hypothetical protein